MRTPAPSHITVDPELAVLQVLDTAAAMAIAVLMVFHPSASDPEAQRCHDHLIANCLINEAHRLRQILADYQHALDLERGLLDDDLPF